MPGVTSRGNEMSPVLADIKRVFDEYRSGLLDFQMKYPTCQKAPFRADDGDYWMYHYLFPEILLEGYVAAPCYFFTEEQVLRIMAEHGLL